MSSNPLNETKCKNPIENDHDEYRDAHVPRRATALRDGSPAEIDAAELVPGDVVLLKPGHRVSADLSIIEAHDCSVDTSTLTGESGPAVLVNGQNAYAGTFLVQGEAKGRVIATGHATRLAGLVRLTRAEHRPRSPLAQELDRVVRIIAAVAVSLGVVFMAVAASLGMSLNERSTQRACRINHPAGICPNPSSSFAGPIATSSGMR